MTAPYPHRIQIHFTLEQMAWLRERAAAGDVSIAEVVRRLVRAAMEESR